MSTTCISCSWYIQAGAPNPVRLAQSLDTIRTEFTSLREEAMELEKMQREAAGVLQREMANLTTILMQMQVRPIARFSLPKLLITGRLTRLAKCLFNFSSKLSLIWLVSVSFCPFYLFDVLLLYASYRSSFSGKALALETIQRQRQRLLLPETSKL